MSSAAALVWLLSFVAFGQEESAPEPDPIVVRVKEDAVNLRAGAASNFRSLKDLSKDEILIKVAEQAGWYQVEVPQGFSAYVSSNYVAMTGHGKGVITDGGVNIRPYPSSQPDSNSLPIGKLPEMTEVVVLKQENNWTTILAPPGLKAWVHSDLVEVEGPLDGAWKEKIIPIWEQARTDALASLGPDPEAIKRQQEEESRGTLLDELEKKVSSLEALGSALPVEGAEAIPELGSDDIVPVLAQIQAIEEQSNSEETRTRATELLARANVLADSLKEAPALKPDDFEGGELAVGAEGDKAEKPTIDLSKPIEPFVPEKLTPYAYKNYDAVGWISVVNSDREAPVHIRKSGATIFRLVCPDNRYDLADFANKEIGVYGKKIAVDGAPHLIEVERVVILSR